MNLTSTTLQLRANYPSVDENILIEMAVWQGMRESTKKPMFDGPHSTLIISACCECGKATGVKNGMGAPGGISHGICQPCFDKRYNVSGPRKQG